MPDQTPTQPDVLDLYRLAVQHPLAEVSFVEHAWAHFHGEASDALLLREDFAGTCAVAAAWCASDPARQAMAVELDEPTARWAAARFDDPDLHIVADDVMAVDGPAVDVTLALNFSMLIYHDAAALLGYLRQALAGLNPGGLLVMDLFGGSSVAEPSMERREVVPDEGGFEPFVYVWQQDGLDAATGRIGCRIHFELAGGGRLRDAFVYDWRLWSAREVVDLAGRAGFAEASLWWSEPGAAGRARPVDREPGAGAWVGYIVCRAPG